MPDYDAMFAPSSAGSPDYDALFAPKVANFGVSPGKAAADKALSDMWHNPLEGVTVAPKGWTPYNLPPTMQAGNQPPAPSTASDVIKSFGGGLERGGASLLGFPGDVIKAARMGAGALGLPTTQTPVFGSREALSEAQKILPAPHQPQTTAGEYARTVGEFAPAAIGGPEGMAGRAARYALAPAVASETAGQLTKGTPMEPYARAAGSLVSMGGAGATRDLLSERAAAKALPTTEDLKQSAQRAYQRAEDAGVVVNPKSFDSMVQDLRTDITKQGFDADLHPSSARVLSVMEKRSGSPKTLGELDTLRQVVSDVGKSPEAGERRIAQLMKGHIDDYLDNLSHDDVTSGHPLVAVNSLKQARATWQRKAKSELLDNVFQRAKDTAGQFSVSGMENALRTEFRRLSRNQRQMRTFTADEKAAIRKVGRGGPIENVLRWAGKFAPTGVVPAMAVGGAAAALGGPAGLAGAIGAAGARVGATAMAHRNADRVRQLMVSGKMAEKAKGSPVNTALAGRMTLLNALGY